MDLFLEMSSQSCYSLRVDGQVFLFGVPENRIFIFALAGLARGLLIDVFLLKKWMKHIYDIDS